MKKLIVFLVIGIFLLFASAPLGAQTATATLSVMTSITASCEVSSSELVFPNYSGEDTEGTAEIEATCSAGFPATIGLDEGLNKDGSSTPLAPLRRMMKGYPVVQASYLAYELHRDEARITGWGNGHQGYELHIVGTGGPETVTVYGKIPAGQTAEPGNYYDTVTIFVHL